MESKEGSAKCMRELLNGQKLAVLSTHNGGQPMPVWWRSSALMICAFCTLSRAGFRIPDFLCVTADAYRASWTARACAERILLELHR